MTSASYNQLVAYLKSMAAKNRGESTQTNQQAAGGGSGGNSGLSSAIIKYGPKAAKWGYNAYTQPASATATEGAATGATNIAGGQLASEGLAGVGWGGAASLLAPFLMMYLKYQAGSGVNEPLRKKYETGGIGKMLSDMIDGQKIDPVATGQNYGIKPKAMPAWLDPNSSMNAGEKYSPDMEMVDPRGYSPWELYTGMHRYGSGHKQSGGVGNSGYNDQQLDDMFGDKKGNLSTILGSEVPDWSKTNWDASGFDAAESTTRKKELADKLAAMTQSERGDVLNRNRQWLPEGGALDDKFYLESLEREREREEIEKLLGYKLGG